MDENFEFLRERYELAVEKIYLIPEEDAVDKEMGEFFREVADFLRMTVPYDSVEHKEYTRSGESSGEEQLSGLEDPVLLTEKYETSYANPRFAVKKLGADWGSLLSCIFGEVRSIVFAVKEDLLEEMLIRMELFLEVYSLFVYEWQELKCRPERENVRRILYWYVSDYADITLERELEQMLSAEKNGSVGISGAAGYRGLLMWDEWKPRKTLEYSENMLQYDLDHREDMALVWDKALMRRKLEVIRTVCERHGKSLTGVVRLPIPERKEAYLEGGLLRFSKEQIQLLEEYAVQAENLLQQKES